MSNSTAIFACSDIEATIAYYKDVLGFTSSWTWGEPPTFGNASMGGVSIMFALDPELAARIHGHQHWIGIEDADEMYQIHRSRNARIISELEDKPWEVREYVIEDLNGYHLRFAGPLSAAPKPSASLPQGITFERRTPTSEEFAQLESSSPDSSDVTQTVLESCWSGIVALIPNRQVVGMLRIVRDGARWFSIWDVAVHPEWQGRHIGATMVKEALALIRESSPGAIVYLFTFKHGFYKKLGFEQESVTMQRL